MADTQKDEPADVPNDYTRTAWAEILKGWEHVPGDGLHDNGWVPPGRTRSAAYADEHGILYVFTTSTEFEAGTPYTKFEAYALLNHGGDRHAAEADLHSQGFGVFRRRDGDGNQIIRCGRYSYTWPADRGTAPRRRVGLVVSGARAVPRGVR